MSFAYIFNTFISGLMPLSYKIVYEMKVDKTCLCLVCKMKMDSARPDFFCSCNEGGTLRPEFNVSVSSL